MCLSGVFSYWSCKMHSHLHFLWHFRTLFQQLCNPLIQLNKLNYLTIQWLLKIQNMYIKIPNILLLIYCISSMIMLYSLPEFTCIFTKAALYCLFFLPTYFVCSSLLFIAWIIHTFYSLHLHVVAVGWDRSLPVSYQVYTHC